MFRLEKLVYRAKVIGAHIASFGLKVITFNKLPAFAAASALIVKDGKVLLIERYDGNGHCFPGGFVDSNEQPDAAIIREVKEETGYDVVLGPVFAVRNNTDKPWRHLTSVVVTYEATIIGGTLTESGEGMPVWFPLSALPKDLLKETRKALNDYLAQATLSAD